MPSKKAKSVIIYTASIVGALVVIWQGFDFVAAKLEKANRKFIEVVVTEKIVEMIEQRKGGTKTSISLELIKRGKEVLPEDIPEMIAKDHVMINDTMRRFMRIFSPVLIRLKSHPYVGIRREIKTGQLWYEHIDGRIYQAIIDPSTKEGYFINELGDSEPCK